MIAPGYINLCVESVIATLIRQGIKIP